MSESTIYPTINELTAQKFLTDIQITAEKAERARVKSLVDKIGVLRYLLISCTIDEENVLGSEQKTLMAFNEDERKTIKDKIFEIIEEL
jgi:hypothetical protein